ncbi:MAG: hypothetical protein IJF40_01070 [Clostridia bacterium]|nr:hypothetical protein [Clostridia bacterium]
MELMTFKCPNCGGNILFDSTGQQFRCESCDSVFAKEQLEEYEQMLKKSEAPSEYVWEQETEREQVVTGSVSYICEYCGAEIVGDETTAATECVYCGSPVIMNKKLSGIDKPDYVIPFKLTKEDAKTALKNFYNKKPLLPKEFKDENRIEKISGVYVPFWLFDCGVDANIVYDATRVRTWSDSRYIYTKTSHFAVARGGSMEFERIPADGSSKMEDRYMDAIEPFDYSEMQEFAPAYLSGYLADKYDVQASACEPHVNERVNASTNETFRSTVKGYATVIPKSQSVNIRSGKAKYALLPVWMLTTRYKDKPYTFAMNGQTGKLVGELPVDKGKVIKWMLGIAAAAFAVGQIFLFLN